MNLWVNFDPQNTPYTTAGINNNPVVTATVTNASCTGTGAIDVSVTGGAGSYTYSWSDGPTTQDRSFLNAGSYTVTVTSNGCSVVKSYTVNDVTVAKPTSLALSSVTNCSAKLSWVAAAGAASYEVRYRITGGVYSSPVNVGAVTNYTFTGLNATTSYDFQVRSVCAGGAEKSAYAEKINYNMQLVVLQLQ
ncbi:MAG: fibronectin type III domain-containing protein [Chitinophagaceae bacterium]